MDTNYQIIDGIVHEATGMPITPKTKDYLTEIQKWALFFAIAGFVSVGMLVLATVFMPRVLTATSGLTNTPPGTTAAIGFIYILMAVLYFVPTLYMLNFSRRLKTAFIRNDSGELGTAFKYLKSHFKFIGILIIVFLSLYVVILLIALLASMAAFM
jgi:hypothetical protein